MALLRWAQHTAWSYQSGNFLNAVAKSSMTRRIVVLSLTGVMVGVARRLFHRPTGGHAGEVAAAIWFRSGQMPFWHTLGRAVVSILAVGFGAAVGRESAPKQAGAAISNALARFGTITSSERRLLVACGAGAGMAAVYNVPFGGALFALEVLLGEMSLALAIPALVTSAIAVAVSWFFLPNKPTYSIPSYPFSIEALGGAAALGVVAGLASVLYVKVISLGRTRGSQRDCCGKCSPRSWVLAGLGAAAIPLPQLLGNGKDVVQLAFLDQLSLPILAILLLPRALATVGSLACGTPGGLFTPTMTVGALIGGLRPCLEPGFSQ